MGVARCLQLCAAGLASAALAACAANSSGGGAPVTSGGGAPVSPSPVATGPATSNITLTGDATIAGRPLAGLKILCRVPDLDGASITMSGTPQGQPANAVSVVVTIRSGMVRVRQRGNGPRNVRDFTGQGVSGFNAATEATLSGTLTETTDPLFNKGTIGTITSITGSVKCGGQTPGSTNMKLTGDTEEGPLVGPLNSAIVECTGQEVIIRALTSVGGSPAFVYISINRSKSNPEAPEFRISSTLKSGDRHFYERTQGTSSLTATSAHVDGDLAEQAIAGLAPSKPVHLKGDATCGTTGT